MYRNSWNSCCSRNIANTKMKRKLTEFYLKLVEKEKSLETMIKNTDRFIQYIKIMIKEGKI